MPAAPPDIPEMVFGHGRGLQATITAPSFASISFSTTDRVVRVEPGNEQRTIWVVV